MEQFFAISDHMSCAYRHWQLRLPINLFNFYLLRSPRFNTCVPGIHLSDGENTQAALCFSVGYFFSRRRSQILTAKARSQCQSQLYSINANYH